MIKLNDIKMLTGLGKYVSDTPLGFVKDKIEKWQAEYGLQICPDFQRGHVWTTEQQIAFVEFILRGGRTAPIQFNHPGWMHTWKGDFVCVDGLQRLTALIKFLSNELPVFGGNYLNDFDDPAHLLRKHDIQFRINDLKTHKEVLTWYLEMNSGGTPHTESELLKVKEMLEAFCECGLPMTEFRGSPICSGALSTCTKKEK